MEKDVSPCKSDYLKKTSSTASSAALKTIDRIKKMHSLGGNAGRELYKSTTIKIGKGPVIEDFKVLKYLE